VKQGGQSDHTVRRVTSNMIQIELSIISALPAGAQGSLKGGRSGLLRIGELGVSANVTSVTHAIYAGSPPAVATVNLWCRASW
jgi:hypothetical protein